MDTRGIPTNRPQSGEYGVDLRAVQGGKLPGLKTVTNQLEKNPQVESDPLYLV